MRGGLSANSARKQLVAALFLNEVGLDHVTSSDIPRDLRRVSAPTNIPFKKRRKTFTSHFTNPTPWGPSKRWLLEELHVSLREMRDDYVY